MPNKRLVIFAEGEGDAQALPILLQKMLTHQFQDEWYEWVFVDPDVFRIKGVDNLGSKTAEKFVRWTQVAQSRGQFGGLLVVLDADSTRSTCLLDDVRTLVNFLQSTGAGITYPAAVVLLQQEYEMLMLASCSSLTDLKEGTLAPSNIETVRGCKEWLHQNLKQGYASIPRQAELTRQLSMELLVQANVRSYKRFQHAIKELVTAIRTSTPLLTPSIKGS